MSSKIAKRRETGIMYGLSFAASIAHVMSAISLTFDFLLITRLSSAMDLMDSEESFENVLTEVTSNLTSERSMCPYLVD